MKRYTEKALRVDVDAINRELAASGSAYYYKVWPRNGYCAVDLCTVYSDGSHHSIDCAAAGSPRECYADIARRYGDYSNAVQLGQRITQRMAKAVIAPHISIVVFLAEQPYSKPDDVALLVKWASKCRFKHKGATHPETIAVLFADKLESLK